MLAIILQAPQAPAMMERLSVLKDDPELKDIFEDMKTNGAAAFSKYVATAGNYSQNPFHKRDSKPPLL